MNELDRDLVFSEAVKAGKRIYYFDVKQSKNGERYVSITESKKIVEGTFENPRISFEKHKIFLYKEDYDKFLNAFLNTLQVAKGGEIPAPADPAPEYHNPYTPAASAPSAPSVAPAPAAALAEAVEAAPVAAEPASDATSSAVSEPKTEMDSFKIDLDF